MKKNIKQNLDNEFKNSKLPRPVDGNVGSKSMNSASVASSSFKCGKVVFIGEANVGKSSLLNKLVGEHVSIVTDMAGTTREQIRGYLTGKDFQIIFLDTPGMGQARTSLDKYMNKSISFALASADVICYVLDACDIRDEYLQKIKNLIGKKPLIVVVNKVDKTNFEKLYPQLSKINEIGQTAAIIPVSALKNKSLDILIKEIVKVLPEGTAVVGDDEYTDQSLKKMCAEIIRGELIKRIQAEIPHGIAVQIESWQETGHEIEIKAEIICIKPGHKPIIIGKRGAVLKAVGIASRAEIEKITGKHICLYTHVSTRENWKNKPDMLEDFGYVK